MFRRPRVHDREHLAYVRQQPCCVCGTRFHVEAAHIRMASVKHDKRPTGMGETAHDRWTVPLCAYHHRLGPHGLAQHKGSERLFWEQRGIDPFEIAKALWQASGGAARAARREPTLATLDKKNAREPSP
jgi:hypothetical protein